MIRKIVYAVIVGLAIYFIATNYQELLLILEVFSHADGYLLILAVLVQVVWLIVFAANFQACYNLLGLNESIRHLVPVTAAANFMNVVAPSYGAGALAVFLFDGHQQGKPAAKVSTSAFLMLVYDYVASLVILIPALIYLAYQNVLDTIIFGAALFAISMGVTLIAVTILGIRSANQLSNIILLVTERMNKVGVRLFKRDLINENRARGFANDLVEGLKHISLSPGAILIPALWALLRRLLQMVILFIVSWAFHNPFDLGTLLASYGVSFIFTIASVTPSGVGFVEGAMGLTQNALGVDPVTSAAIAILYRGVTFWLVLFYGLIAIRWVGYSLGNGKRHIEERDKEFSPPKKVESIKSQPLSMAEMGNPSIEASSQELDS